MSFGGQTVTLQAVTRGAADRLGIKAISTVSSNVTGCLFRPVDVAEDVSDTDVVEKRWKATLPPVAAALAADETDRLVYSGDTYEITSVEQHPDLSGAIHHVTIFCRRWVA